MSELDDAAVGTQNMSLDIVEYTSLDAPTLASLQTQDGKTHLFNSLVCPFGHRALWTAVEVDAAFDMIGISLTAMPESYKTDFNRFGTVPFLLDDGEPVYESTIISQYIDAKVNGGKLYCADAPRLAALAQLAVAKFEPSRFYAILHNSDDAKMPALEAEMRASLQGLERIYREHAAAFRAKGPYLLGDRFSSAEINIMTFLFRFDILLQHYRHVRVLGDDIPLLSAALKASVARPAFALTARDADFYIRGFAHHIE
uniref:Glutathione-dependent dehydroascorbate reductase n=1 Tax=Hucho hucho TaxID=62062 RepID=A0A4W5L6H1_9TELE